MTFSIRRKASFISLNLLSLNLRYRGILCYSIKFKYIFVLNLIILRKDIIVYILLVNVTMYLNLIGKLNILHLNFAINIMRNLLLKRKASFAWLNLLQLREKSYDYHQKRTEAKWIGRVFLKDSQACNWW